MATKLTLSINENTIKSTKRYAKAHQTSLSSLVEQYFNYLTADQIEEGEQLSPLVSELAGVIDLEQDFDLESEYAIHLEEKYLK